MLLLLGQAPTTKNRLYAKCYNIEEFSTFSPPGDTINSSVIGAFFVAPSAPRALEKSRTAT